MTWRLYRGMAERIDDQKRRERFLVPYGPVSLVGLLVMWVAMLAFGWGLIWWGLQNHIQGIDGVISAVVEGLNGILTTALVIGLLPTPLYAEFRAWDIWCADGFDSHTASPMLVWFRSRQPGRSWTVGFAMVLLRVQFERVHAAVLELGLPARPLEEACARRQALRADCLLSLLALNGALLAPLEFRTHARPIPIEMG